MRAALLSVFFKLIILTDEIYTQDEGFRPTPIPLNEWHHERREGRVGSQFEASKTELQQYTAALPAHYWEDALRHSVYLTLVRDKIDELIAKGDVISPNTNPGDNDSKDIDDHDLWDKIKTAPFDRIQDEDPGSYGDVTIMAKGRLIEDERGFRFIEDERTKEKCSDDNCIQGVKAFWSVKRVKQRDQEISPGKYHYELTFSVISQMPKKQRRPYENPIRTFTVKEGFPASVKQRPHEFRKFRQGLSQVARPERAIWVHKNVGQWKQTGRNYFQGLDRIFSSFFSEDEDRSFDSPAYKFSTLTTQIPLYSKTGHASPLNDQHFQIPFPYRPYSLKQVRPPLQVTPINPILHPHLDMSLITSSSNSHGPFSYDHRVESIQPVKTTRPAVLPTPVPQTLPYNSQSGEVTNMMSTGTTDNTPADLDSNLRISNSHNKYKAAPVKVNYFAEHVRPPIYSAPPGVFVTMDKKPFKPMPPVKLMHSPKPYRTNKPIDFRPSPQVTNVLNTDSVADDVFRPITINLDKTTENLSVTEATRKVENKLRKTTSSRKKPLKKHDNTKSQRTTTLAPDILTAQSTSGENFDSMDWANILGAFTKTTPMFSQTEKIQTFQTTTPMTKTKTPTTTQKIITTAEAIQDSTISSTAKPKKRTRPPPKFAKQEKIKKHKRISITTTSTMVPENDIRKDDLTPQATSAATGITKSTKFYKDLKNTTQTTNSAISTTSSTTTHKSTTTTTTTAATTTTPLPNITPTEKTITSTTQSRSKNRFRQSTLMLKGTSVKHDRWNAIQKNQTVTTPYSTHSTYRRKGSNFHGYITSTTPRFNDEKLKQIHADGKPSSGTEANTMKTTEINAITNPSYAETIDEYDANTVLPLDEINEKSEQDYEDESKDHSEFIFQPTSASVLTLSTSPTPSTNITKCKKKKPASTTEKSMNKSDTLATTTTSYTTVTTTKTPADKSTTKGIFEELLNFNFNDDADENDDTHSGADLENEESMNHESYLKIDDFEDLLDIHFGDSKEKNTELISDDDNYKNKDEDDNDEDDDEDEYQSSKISQEDDTELHSYDDNEREDPNKNSNNAGSKEKRPFTLLELMAMS